jgi:hypothetical protein
MRGRVGGELDLLKVYKTITSLDDDVIQALRRLIFLVALEFHSAIASRCVKPVAQNLQALAILVNVPGRSDCSVLDVLRHGGARWYPLKWRLRPSCVNWSDGRLQHTTGTQVADPRNGECLLLSGPPRSYSGVMPLGTVPLTQLMRESITRRGELTALAQPHVIQRCLGNI